MARFRPANQVPVNQGYRRAPRVFATRKPRRRRRLRWNIVYVLSTLLFAAWLLSGVQASVSFNRLMTQLGVDNRERFTMSVCLVLFIIMILLIARVLRKDSDDDV